MGNAVLGAFEPLVEQEVTPCFRHLQPMAHESWMLLRADDHAEVDVRIRIDRSRGHGSTQEYSQHVRVAGEIIHRCLQQAFAGFD